MILPREWRPLMRGLQCHKGPMALGSLLGWLAVLAAVGLLALAGWFLTAAAVAGLTAAGAAQFNFFLPSVGVRLFAFVRTLARYGERIFSHDATFRILESLRDWFFRRIEPLVPAVLFRYPSGDILGRAVEDIDTLDNLYLRVLSPTAVAATATALLGLFLWRLDPGVALAAAAVWVLNALLPVGSARLGRKAGEALSRASVVLRTRTVAYLQGLAEIWIYGADGHHLEAIRQDDRALQAVQGRMNALNGACTAMLVLFSGLGAALVLYVGAGRCADGRLDGARLALAMLAFLASFDAFWPLPNAFLHLSRTREAARRLVDITDAAAPVDFPPVSESPPDGFDLAFDRVHFAYAAGAPPVLDRFDLRVASGRRVAVLGASGAGKSTLAHLLARFQDPDEGRILIGGRELRTFSETDLRRWVCIISQQAHIFNATLADNLRLSNPEASQAQLRDALAAAGLMQLLAELPDGLETWLGETGRRLSGGQARRLAVARAFLSDAPIWVLDEPTEGLDPRTARILTTSILKRSNGKTLLWITHRPSEAALLDRVVFLDGGRVTAEGEHQTLYTQHQRYRDLISGGVLS
ncbi:thiol reductant ABC exporter subunit CydC [Desulfatitalea tepidiphila]|uniref:thiol reductant ABC exporter subunit CydC n=1 Tax=Desulfatitalea tepidiphila TaxID=1185843 RepID=UPI0006B5C752|nr:thiol reductant ABC exporter subunit CydC [Desulfatitalea tepidiphila]